MKDEELEYESPMLIEIGEFSELTRVTCCGRWLDNPFWVSAWFDL
ncbi:lasso RiPP family leader peptide-containing protein [Streptomyces sp. NPDC094034]